MGAPSTGFGLTADGLPSALRRHDPEAIIALHHRLLRHTVRGSNGRVEDAAPAAIIERSRHARVRPHRVPPPPGDRLRRRPTARRRPPSPARRADPADPATSTGPTAEDRGPARRRHLVHRPAACLDTGRAGLAGGGQLSRTGRGPALHLVASGRCPTGSPQNWSRRSVGPLRTEVREFNRIPRTRHADGCLVRDASVKTSENFPVPRSDLACFARTRLRRGC